jgi:molecular chaperone HtpG
MEKVLNSMPQNDKNRVTAQKSLELNAGHPVFEKLKELYKDDKDKLTEYTKLLYSQALLIEGLTIENPVEFADLICKLMV